MFYHYDIGLSNRFGLNFNDSISMAKAMAILNRYGQEVKNLVLARRCSTLHRDNGYLCYPKAAKCPIIVIDVDLLNNPSKFIDVVKHEMAHLEDFYNGLLSWSDDRKTLLWRGVPVVDLNNPRSPHEESVTGRQ